MAPRAGWIPPNKSAALICPACGKQFHRSPTKRRGDRPPACSRPCRGIRDRDLLAQTAGLGRSGWTDDSRASHREKMSGESNPAWKGGVTYKRPKGNYIGPRYVRCPVDLLVMARADGYVMEHRLVMARWVGRPLLRTECVNHIDRDPRNNVRSNLELYPSNGDHKRGEVGRFVAGVANRLYLLD
jgi:endogenous inhibitor of DNA gyrase (YacG/DUF329 family)